MTEQEWVASKTPEPLLEFLLNKAIDRKLRLFAVACCRHVWHLLSSEDGRNWVDLAEKHADGEVGPSKLKTARKSYQPIQGRLPSPSEMATWAAVSTIRPSAW